MKLGDGLFLNTFRQVAEEYKHSGITANDMIVDNTCVQSALPQATDFLTRTGEDPCNLSQGLDNLTSW